MAKGKRGAGKGGGKKKGSSVVGCITLLVGGLIILSFFSPRSSQKSSTPASPKATQRQVSQSSTSDAQSEPSVVPNQVAQSQSVVEVAAQAGDEDSETGMVISIIDGDTIDVNIDGETARIRYIGVNTPERDEACSNEATAANAALVAGQTVLLLKDISETDRFDRLLRYVYVGDTFVNAELVRQGFAEAVEYPPDTAHADEFEALETEARNAALGCHPTGVFGGAVEVTPIRATPVPVGGLTVQDAQTYYVTSNANARSCERTDCTILARLSVGEAVSVTGWIQGDSVSGNDIWRQISLDGDVAYVHSGLLSTSAPVQVQQQQQPAQPTVEQLMSTPPPLVEQPVAPSWSCSGDIYNCADLTCQEMASYWAACPGDPSDLDGNEDGEYCESKC